MFIIDSSFDFIFSDDTIKTFSLDPIGAASSLRTAVDAGLATYSLPVYPKTIDGDDVLLLSDDASVVLDFFRGVGPPPPPTS